MTLRVFWDIVKGTFMYLWFAVITAHSTADRRRLAIQSLKPLCDVTWNAPCPKMNSLYGVHFRTSSDSNNVLKWTPCKVFILGHGIWSLFVVSMFGLRVFCLRMTVFGLTVFCLIIMVFGLSLTLESEIWGCPKMNTVHYAGTVDLNVTGWLDKNKDPLNDCNSAVWKVLSQTAGHHLCCSFI